MPGVGKTYWGRKIAAEYAMTYYDLDQWIEEREGKSIANIFEEHGERYFRQVEHQQLIALIRHTGNNAVIACGGGTPCFYENMRNMKIAGVVIYLESTIAQLVSNLTGDNTIRPLLSATNDLTQTLSTMLMARRPFYEEAHVILRTNDISVATFGQISGNE
jgi:shikimate kinase